MTKFTVSMALLSLLLLLADAATAQVDTLDGSNYARSIAKWQEEREANLKGSNGWLNLAGLHWLQAGATSIGSATDNDIVLVEEAAPPKAGRVLAGRRGRDFSGRARSGGVQRRHPGNATALGSRRGG